MRGRVREKEKKRKGRGNFSMPKEKNNDVKLIVFCRFISLRVFFLSTQWYAVKKKKNTFNKYKIRFQLIL